MKRGTTVSFVIRSLYSERLVCESIRQRAIFHFRFVSPTYYGRPPSPLQLTYMEASPPMEPPATIHSAAELGEMGEVGRLLEAEPFLLEQTSSGYTALIWAAVRGRVEVVELLVQKGAQLEAKDSTWGTTALISAALNGQRTVVESLLTLGSDPTATDNEGNTALLWAAGRGHDSVVKVLLPASMAGVHVKNKDGVTALAWAQANNHTMVVQALLAHTAQVLHKSFFSRIDSCYDPIQTTSYKEDVPMLMLSGVIAQEQQSLS
jgi:ankyrin repeat protein